MLISHFVNSPNGVFLFLWYHQKTVERYRYTVRISAECVARAGSVGQRQLFGAGWGATECVARAGSVGQRQLFGAGWGAAECVARAGSVGQRQLFGAGWGATEWGFNLKIEWRITVLKSSNGLLVLLGSVYIGQFTRTYLNCSGMYPLQKTIHRPASLLNILLK
jgi:hypothetical protein